MNQQRAGILVVVVVGVSGSPRRRGLGGAGDGVQSEVQSEERGAEEPAPGSAHEGDELAVHEGLQRPAGLRRQSPYPAPVCAHGAPPAPPRSTAPGSCRMLATSPSDIRRRKRGVREDAASLSSAPSACPPRRHRPRRPRPLWSFAFLGRGRGKRRGGGGRKTERAAPEPSGNSGAPAPRRSLREFLVRSVALDNLQQAGGRRAFQAAARRARGQSTAARTGNGAARGTPPSPSVAGLEHRG